MKKMVFLFMLCFFNNACSATTIERPMTTQSCLDFFKSVRNPSTKVQLELYSKVEECQKFFDKDGEILSQVLNSYAELFKVNLTHFHLEPFLPFYEKNKARVNALVKKILNKKDADEFFFRLKTALRENAEGNG